VTQIQTIEAPETRTGGGGTDGEHYAHIVKRPDDEPSASAYITKARVFGMEVEALCGYRWIPARDPEKLPVCPLCKAALEATP
jgi:hypothetical protein